jgi:predicted nucleic acid-binding protein
VSRKWVTNASPLILLGKIGKLSWLESLSGEFIIPLGVAEEVRAGVASDAARKWIVEGGDKYIREIGQIDPVIAAWDLGVGETQVLMWARQNAGFEALLDDRAARTCAATLQIPVRGTLGIVLVAKREGLIAQAKPVIEELMKAGMRIDLATVQAVEKLASE